MAEFSLLNADDGSECPKGSGWRQIPSTGEIVELNQDDSNLNPPRCGRKTPPLYHSGIMALPFHKVL
jgi:hypothetical protein